MSFTLEERPPRQPAWPRTPSQREQTGYTGFRMWPRLWPGFVAQRWSIERLCELTSLKVNSKTFCAHFYSPILPILLLAVSGNVNIKMQYDLTPPMIWMNAVFVFTFVSARVSWAIVSVLRSYRSVTHHYSLLFAGVGGPISWSVYIVHSVQQEKKQGLQRPHGAAMCGPDSCWVMVAGQTPSISCASGSSGTSLWFIPH